MKNREYYSQRQKQITEKLSDLSSTLGLRLIYVQTLQRDKNK